MTLAPIFGALKYMPASLGIKALQKVNPKFKNYFANAASYGVDANRALEYLTDRFESDAQRTYKGQLEQGAAQGNLRPDEAVSRSQMANAAIPGKILKGAASLAIGGGLGGMGQEEQVQPQKSKGLAQNIEQDVESMGEPIQDQFPQLMQFVQQRIQEGQDPIQAARLARNTKAYGKLVQRMEQETGTSFENYIAQKFGGQSQQPQTSVQGKDQFLGQLNQLGQMLQGLKGKR